MIPVVHHPAYVVPAPSSSGYRWNKNGLIRDLLRERGDAFAWFEPVAMPRRWIEEAHDPDYVAEVIAAEVPREKERRIGFPVTDLVAARAQIVPGGTWLAATLALEHGFAANSAGGSHHALAATGAGYCIFNDLAIAAIRLVEEGRAERVLIVDCDVHQGDGTAALTAGRPGIATYSIHAEKNFPVRKAQSTLDVPLADGTGDAEYLETLETTLLPLVDQFAPDLILYQAGVDPLAEDRGHRVVRLQVDAATVLLAAPKLKRRRVVDHARDLEAGALSEHTQALLAVQKEVTRRIELHPVDPVFAKGLARADGNTQK